VILTHCAHRPETMAIESTLAIVKPNAFDRVDEVVTALKEAGFVVAEREVVQLTNARASDFYKEHAGRPFFDDLVTFMTSGSVLALVLRAPDAIVRLRETVGPTDPAAGSPSSLRARFGESITRNAIHASDSSTSAAREIAFFFPEHAEVHTSGKSAKQYLASSVAPLLTKALTEMCRLMPADPAEWLGEYLLASSPNSSSKAAVASAPANTAGPKIYFVLGNAGSGKGSQCAKLVEKFKFTHLSAGDLLRAEVASGSPEGTEIAELIKDGKIVPGETTINLLKKAISAAGDVPGILVDGFPRELTQAGAFEKDVSPFEFVLFFDCPEEELECRLLGRGATSGRTDDNIESIRKRFSTFRETCYPVIQYYKARGQVYHIDATRSIDEIFTEVSALF
jgi:UMP-CMP kinase